MVMQDYLLAETYTETSVINANTAIGVVDYSRTRQLQEETIYSYDEFGNLFSEIFERDSDADGNIDFRTSNAYTYDNTGKLITHIYQGDVFADGVVDILSNTKKTYDSKGNLIVVIEESDSDGNGTIDSRFTITNTYDAEGNLVTVIEEVDSDGNGTIDSRSTITNTYDAEGNLVTVMKESDSNGNGDINSRSTITNTYDAEGNLIAVLVESDKDGNNTIDYRSTTSTTYDAAGNLISESFEADVYRLFNYGSYYVSPDGIIDIQSTTTNTYDDAGNLITHIYEYYDSTTYTRASSSTTNTYDVEGYLIASVSKEYSGSTFVGGVSSESITTNTYDFNGNQIATIGERHWRARYDLGEERTNTTYIYGSLFNADAGFIDLTHFVGVAEVEFTLARDAGNDNFVGFYPIIDTNGGIDTNDDTFADLYPGDSGYTEAVLANYQTDLALVVADGEQANIFHQFEGPALYAPFMIAAGMPNDPDSFSLSEVYFPFVVANADGVEHIKYEDGRLLFEDWLGGGDFDYNDAVLQIRFLADKTSALLDLTDLTGMTSIQFTLSREAANDNFVGFYRVTDANGGIDVDGDGVADLRPGDSGYTEAVLANFETNIALLTADGQDSVFSNQLAGGALYAPFMVADGNPIDPGSFGLAEVYFAFAAANADGAVHIKFQDGSLRFEDWFGGGDNDFNDAVVQIQVM
jgi:nitrate reductase NapAB chaperone NapD